LRAAQARVRETLSAISEDSFNAERLAFCAGKVVAFSVNQTPEEHIELYVWIIQALLHHSRIGGLKSAEVNRLHQLALQLLALYRVRPGTTKVGDFHADLAHVMSHVEYGCNRPWVSLWELNNAERHRDNDGNRNVSTELSVATRLFKIGSLDEAREIFVKHSEHEITSYQVRALLGLAKVDRWKGLGDESWRWIEQAQSVEFDVPADLVLETEWEAILNRAIRSGNIEELYEVFSSKSRFYSEVYVLEANLWCLALNPHAVPRDKPTMLQLQNRRNLRLMTCPEVYDALKHFEACDDKERSFESRMEAAQSIFELSFAMAGTDAPPLSLVALAKWIKAHRLDSQLNLIVHRLKSLCHQRSQTLWTKMLD
jgi:hypothetical protein